ncbi:unnamed protein product, partial [Closterium sp. Naga37s-1]
HIKSASEETDFLVLKGLKGLSDSILSHLSTLTNLKWIDLKETSGFSAEGVRNLYKLPKLEMLDFRWSGVSDSALQGIGSLTSLKILRLWDTNVTNAGLAHLTGLSSLKELDLSQCTAVTDAGMVHVG